MVAGWLLLSGGSGLAGVIPDDRLPPPGTWESAGVEGGIPNRQTIFANVTQAPYRADNTGGSDAVAAIQAAVDACPVGQVVYIPPGRYSISRTISIQKGITLRGAGSSTVFVCNGRAVQIGSMTPWPPAKGNTGYSMDITSGATRGSKTVGVASTAAVPVGKMVMVDQLDDPALCWNINGGTFRSRASLHMVESKTANTVTFRPPLPMTYSLSPRLVQIPDLVTHAGVENIKFQVVSGMPFEAYCTWNCWVYGCEFVGMPSRTLMIAVNGHFEIRKNYCHDQSNGGPNSEGIDLFADCNWCLVVDNTCVKSGFPQINIGDFGVGGNYSAGCGNVIAYNYCVGAWYDLAGTKMCTDISTNHSPHAMYTLVEGNICGRFGSDGYYGSSSHGTLFRNVITGNNTFPNDYNRNAITIDIFNRYFTLVGNVLGEVGRTPPLEYVEVQFGSDGIFRLGYPHVGNDSRFGTHPPDPIVTGEGGQRPRDLHCDRTTRPHGTTLIEGNWNSVAKRIDWSSGTPQPLPNSYFLAAKPAWFGNLKWPPVDPANPVTNDPTIIPAGYRYIRGSDPPTGGGGANQAPTANAQSVTANPGVAVPILLTGSDPDGNPLTYTVLTQPTHGALTGAAPSLTYTANAGYLGGDSFTFRVNDGQADSTTATVSITVQAQPGSAPVANNQTVSTAAGVARAIVLAATDADGDPLTYQIVAGPGHGTLGGTPPNVTYTPAAGYTGADSFTFRASDGTRQSNTATVSITVLAPAQNPPVAVAQFRSTTPGTPLAITLTASDPDGDPLTYAIVTQPAHGALSGTPPNVTYTPAAGFTGSDSFTFRANDGKANSNVATVSLSVTSTTAVPGLIIEAEAGQITAPFVVSNGFVSQAVWTANPGAGGRAAYRFQVDQPGDYAVRAVVDAPDGGSNSFFVNLDAEPTGESMVWSITPHTVGPEMRWFNWTTWTPTGEWPVVPGPERQTFTLAAGEHTLIIRGREGETKLDRIEIRKRPQPVGGKAVAP